MVCFVFLGSTIVFHVTQQQLARPVGTSRRSHKTNRRAEINTDTSVLNLEGPSSAVRAENNNRVSMSRLRCRWAMADRRRTGVPGQVFLFNRGLRFVLNSHQMTLHNPANMWVSLVYSYFLNRSWQLECCVAIKLRIGNTINCHEGMRAFQVLYEIFWGIGVSYQSLNNKLTCFRSLPLYYDLGQETMYNFKLINKKEVLGSYRFKIS